MKLTHLAVAYSFLLLISMSALASHLEEAKKELMKKYDAIVEAKKIKFLGRYGLSVASLDNKEARAGIKESHDKMCRGEIEFYRSQKVAHQKELDGIYKIAAPVFRQAGLHLAAIFHDEAFDLGDISVFYVNDDGQCYVFLNALQHIKNLDMLAAALRHECCHTVYQDNFNKELIQCMAWVNSHEEREEVAEKCYSFCRAFETRADVYAAIHSPDRGQALIEFYNMLPKRDNVLTHPNPEKRIALIKQIQSTLDEAKQRDLIASAKQ